MTSTYTPMPEVLKDGHVQLQMVTPDEVRIASWRGITYLKQGKDETWEAFVQRAIEWATTRH